MHLLPALDEDKKSLIFTVIICAVLGLSFVLFVVAYRNLKVENAYLKSQIETDSSPDISFENQVETATTSGQFQSETNTLELNPKPTVLASPTPVSSQPTITPIPTLTPTPVPFITSATLSIEPSNGDVCGTNFKFRGYITANGQGVVSYRWKRTDAENVTSEPYPTVTFESAGTKEINYYLTLTHNADAEGWFEITSPGSVASNRARYVQQNC